MSTEVYVEKLPKCDFCNARAEYDGRTRMGPWANMCQSHFKQYGVGLGTGKGQRLITRPVAMTENEPGRFSQQDTSEAAFKSWMGKVNACVESSLGVSVYDLADADYRGEFEAGTSAAGMAAMVAEEALEEMGFDW